MTNMGDMMQQLQGLQQKMKDAQDEVERLQVTGAAGGGLVKATVNGKNQAIRIEIDDSLLGDDKDMLEDLIAAAFNDAVAKAAVASAEKMKDAAGGLGGMMPPGFKMPF